MKNLVMLLLLANILYYMWGRFVEEPEETGIVVVHESELGPALDVKRTDVAEAAASVGAVLGTGNPTELEAVVGRSCVTIGPFTVSDDADLAYGDYSGEGMRSEVRTTEGQVFVGHWVQIRNIPDRTVGNEILTKLRDGGLGDAYLVPTDDEGLALLRGVGLEMVTATGHRSMFDARMPRLRPDPAGAGTFPALNNGPASFGHCINKTYSFTF